MEKKYGEHRRHIYASINGTKGNMIKLSKSKLLKGEEPELLKKVIDALSNLSREIKQDYIKWLNI